MPNAFQGRDEIRRAIVDGEIKFSRRIAPEEFPEVGSLSFSDVMNWLAENHICCGCQFYAMQNRFKVWLDYIDSDDDRAHAFFDSLGGEAALWMIDTVSRLYPDIRLTPLIKE